MKIGCDYRILLSYSNVAKHNIGSFFVGIWIITWEFWGTVLVPILISIDVYVYYILDCYTIMDDIEAISIF